NDHGPLRPMRETIISRLLLDRANLFHYSVESSGHQLMHRLGLVSRDKIWTVAVTSEQLGQLFMGNTRENRRTGYFISVEMQDRNHRSVSRRVQKLVGMPARGERAGFRLAVADHAASDEVRVVQHRSIR